jgi:hypothetical protein
VTAVDWSAYQKCTEVCGAELGQPCRELTGYTANSGSGAVVVVDADRPHTGRKRRAGR